MVKIINIQDSIDKNFLFIDVRSEKEYFEDHIPNSINLPVLDDQERHVVGHTYKQVSKEEAIKKGYVIFHQKIETFEKLIKENKNKKIIIYCFRGGLRSKSVADYFSQKNEDIFQLEGGYKSYRKYVMETLNNFSFPKMCVLNGYTGVGKTEMLNLIDNSIDLEGLAQHRSSAFGAVGLNPRTQKMFESLLLVELKKRKQYLVIEGESRKIGDLFIPTNFFDHMKNSKMLLLNSSIETRSKRLIKDYFTSKENILEIEKALPLLTRIIGAKKVLEYKELLDKKEYLEFCTIILKEYYDPRYNVSLKQIRYDQEIDAENVNLTVKKIIKFCEEEL